MNTPSLIVATFGRVDFIERSKIIRIEAESNYSRLFLADGSTLFVAKVLKKFQAELKEAYFIRPHKTHLVNTAFVKSFIKQPNASLVLSNGDVIPVARRNKRRFSAMAS